MARAPAIETHLICRRRSRATRAFRLAFSSLLLGTNDGRLAHLWAAASFPMKREPTAASEGPSVLDGRYLDQ
jgi:hypothetical protein